VNNVTVEEHKQKIGEFISFFSRDPAPYIRRVQKEMESASASQEFERAAKLRDDLIALEAALETSTVVLPDETDADFIALVEGEIEIGATIFSVRHGRIRGQRSVVMERDFDKSSADLYRQLIQDIYSDLTQEIPREICMPQLPEGVLDLQEWLLMSRNEKTNFKVPLRGDKVSLLEIVARNASEALLRHQLLRSSDISKRALALSELQDALNLESAPLRIECFDISHIQGAHAVGSMVVFEDGAPRKSEYRRFEIREGGGDDLASMTEVLTRRLRRLKDEESVDRAEEIAAGLQARRFSYRPQLIVVDGGRAQVDAAARVLEREGFGDIALVGLAKRLEEVWKPTDPRPVILPRKSESLFLLQRLRDESHRFAITYHRSKRGRAMIESLLDEIPGLGEGRRAALLENFTSMKALRLASEAEISQVPGVGPAIAARIVAWFAAESARGETQAVDMGTGEILS
jgi:excinuclease ABC subunit C